jgi:glycosyltransferase involved in cell wall biosynthesis
MQCGNPIIATKTGGLTRQVVDHRDGTENGVALDIEFQTLVGSQTVPYIYEDYCSTDSIANAFLKMYELPKKERKVLGQKAKKYVKSEFNFNTTVDLWDESLTKLVDNWNKNRETRKQWSLHTF